MTTTTSNKKNDSRRNFIRNSIALSAGIVVSSFDANHTIAQQDDTMIGSLSDKTKKFMALFNLKYPIFQAAPGGESLAIALANSGAMGALSLTWASPEEAFQTVTRVKTVTRGNFYGKDKIGF
jgi:hypothetical protein